jgi:hypothetical protein
MKVPNNVVVSVSDVWEKYSNPHKPVPISLVLAKLRANVANKVSV